MSIFLILNVRHEIVFVRLTENIYAHNVLVYYGSIPNTYLGVEIADFNLLFVLKYESLLELAAINDIQIFRKRGRETFFVESFRMER